MISENFESLNKLIMLQTNYLIKIEFEEYGRPVYLCQRPVWWL